MAEMIAKTRAVRKPKKLPPRMQKYVSKSLLEITEQLVGLVESQKDERLSTELRDIIYFLKADRLRNAANAHAFREGGGLTALLQLVSCCSRGEGEDLVLLLGTLGNICALDHQSRSTVMSSSIALTDIVGVLWTSTRTAALNTSARVIANLGMDEASIAALHQLEVVRALAHALQLETVDSGCRQSILRAVRILCADDECLEELKSCDGLVGISECLKDAEWAVAWAALQAVEVLVRYGDSDVIQVLSGNGALPLIVKFCAHTKPKVSKEALQVLLQCCKSCEGRVALSSAGGVEVMVKYLETPYTSSSIFQEVASAVCLCCREALSRQRLRDCGGLERLINMFSMEKFVSLHSNILSALICYYFDENTLKFMVKRLGLLRALTYQLQELSRRPQSQQQLDSMKNGEIKEETQEPPADSSVIKHPCTVECQSKSVDGSDDSEAVQSSEVSSPSGASYCQSLNDLDYSVKSSSRDGSPECQADMVSEAASEARDRQEKNCTPEHSATLLEAALPEPSSPLTSPPAKRPRLQLDFESSTPMPANFLDSLLSSPSPYQPQPKLESPLAADASPSLESQLVLLLSRISHLRDCLTYLAVPEVLTAILSFYFLSEVPNVHAFKVLTRVFMNPHCFQDCIKSLIPSAIHKRLTSPVSASSFSGPSYKGSPFPDLANQLLPCLSSSEFSITSPGDYRRNSIGDSPSHSSYYSPPPISPLVTPGSEYPTSPVAQHSMSQELLERLAKVAESPYGQGVLAHLLLRGEAEERRASALALPLLIRSARVCQRMMLSYQGLELLIALVKEEDSGELQMAATDSLLALARNMQKAGRKRNCRHPEETPSLASRPRTDLSKWWPVGEEFREGELQAPPIATGTKSFCKYHDSDHCPFDLMIHISNSSASVHLPAHRAVLAESSEVFTVMLGGQYRESQGSEIHIQDVHPIAFTSLLHHTYGCGWLCPRVLEEVLHSEDSDGGASCQDSRKNIDTESGEDPALSNGEHSDTGGTGISAMTDSIIEKIVSSFEFLEDRQSARHCLRVLAVASKFLFPGLCSQCEAFASAYLTPLNVVDVFYYSELHQSRYLSQHCIHCIVGLPHSELQRKVFSELMSSSEGITAMERLEAMLTAKLFI